MAEKRYSKIKNTGQRYSKIKNARTWQRYPKIKNTGQRYSKIQTSSLQSFSVMRMMHSQYFLAGQSIYFKLFTIADIEYVRVQSKLG